VKLERIDKMEVYNSAKKFSLLFGAGLVNGSGFVLMYGFVQLFWKA